LIFGRVSILHHLALGLNGYPDTRTTATAASQQITFNRDSLEEVRKEPHRGAEN
jgi:hypothetical protein